MIIYDMVSICTMSKIAADERRWGKNKNIPKSVVIRLWLFTYWPDYAPGKEACAGNRPPALLLSFVLSFQAHFCPIFIHAVHSPSTSPPLFSLFQRYHLHRYSSCSVQSPQQLRVWRYLNPMPRILAILHFNTFPLRVICTVEHLSWCQLPLFNSARLVWRTIIIYSTTKEAIHCQLKK